jgi:Family of unknown function (DUF6318)
LIGRRGRRLRLVGLLAASGLAALAGCGGGDEGSGALPQPTATVETPPKTDTTPPEVTTASTGPGGVPVPAPGPEAGKQSDLGAKAYGVYYVKLLDYTYATRDVAPLRQASAEGCVVCQGTADDVAKFAKPGYKFEGGRINLKNLTVSQPSPSQPVIVANVSISALEVTDADGQRDPYSEAAHPRAQLLITEKWTGNGWTVTDLKVGI